MSRPWSTLGLDGPASLAEIRHAYAERLKTTHPEEDPEGFQELHSAYKLACRLAKKGGGSASHAQAWQTAWEYAPPQEDAPSPKEEEEEQQDWDYDALLEDGKKPPREEKQEEEQQDWDYDELLEDGKKPTREEQQEEEQQDWDYDALLEDGKRTPREEWQEEEQREEEWQDWDYDTLFQQAQTDEDKVYLKRRDVLRKKNLQRYETWPKRNQEQTASEEAMWLRVLEALRRLEWLQLTGAPSDVWEQTLRSVTFRSVLREPDFVFGLEELLREHPELPKQTRKAIRAAYSVLDGEEFFGWYSPLRELWEGKPKKAWHRPLRKLWGEKPKKEWSVRRAYSVLFGVLLSVMTLFVVFGRQSEDKKQTEDVPPILQEEQQLMLSYLEEDFDQKFYFHEKLQWYIAEDIAYPRFSARLEGERDPEQGQWGYTTGYTPEELLRDALSEFARVRGYRLLDDTVEGDYILQFPLTGAEEELKALGTLIAELEEKPWYSRQLPERKVYLCFGRVPFATYSPSQEPFSLDEALTVYTQEFWKQWSAYALEKSGLLQEDVGDDYALFWQGTQEWGDKLYGKIIATHSQTTTKPEWQYYICEDGSRILSFPAEDITLKKESWEEAGESEEIYLEGSNITIEVWRYIPPEGEL